MLTAYCACAAGLSHCCNQVIAFLYKIECAALQGLTNPNCTDAACRFNYRSKRAIKSYRVNDVALEEHATSKRSKKLFPCSKIKTAFDTRHCNRTLIAEKHFFDKLSVIKLKAFFFMSLPKSIGELTPPLFPKVAEVTLSKNNGMPYETLIEVEIEFEIG